MRLLYVIDSLAPGGAETSLADMAPGLVARGVDLHVLPLGRRLDLAPRLLSAGTQIHIPNRRLGRLGNLVAVREVARSIRPNLIHTTLYEADVAGRTAAKTLRIPTSTSIVNDSYGESHYAEASRLKLHAARTLDAATGVLANRFHAISTSIADSLAPRLGIARSKIDVIPRGRDPDAFPFRPAGVRESTRAAIGISAEAPVILSIGRMEPQKGQGHLLAALPALAVDHPDAVVLIAGKEGRASASLRQLATRQPIDIRFLGHRDDVAALLSAADVFCFPSEREGLGGVLIEALATGCPIVATDIPTSREVLSTPNGMVGVLTSREPGHIARGLASLLDHPDYAEELVVSGRKHFEDHFTVERVAGQMVSFFTRAIGG
jgi:glycosyltransferase involved in cell wall biosynthesis